MDLFSQKKRYELVRTAKQHREFERTWNYFCKKYRWNNDPHAPIGIRYNLILPGKPFLQRRKVIGTVEFTRYYPDRPNRMAEGRNGISFYDEEEILRHPGRVWEIDKLCLHQDYQRQGYFQIFLLLIWEHTRKHQTKFYLGLMEEKFYRMLRIWYGLDVIRKGDPVPGPKTTLVPVIFDVENVLHNEEKIKSLVRV